MKKAVCIHGHFYQPSRENPWLEAIEVQDSAHPFHDWNERVTVECYAPNSAARLVDGDGRIVEIVNNYERISFNFGPTLLAWIERHSSEEYRRIQEADRVSAERRGGHGNAIAQPYNHMIMPLATERDRVTQIVWGLREFERHFGRPAEGMWLPEAAVDLKTLDLMALHGIRFTILSPFQARRVRPRGRGRWRDVSGGKIDTTRPYFCRLRGGRKIALFFYDAGIAHEVAFGRLLENGENFGRRLKEAFDPAAPDPQIVHIATDGESYGHHWPHGDMALAYALETIESDPEVDLVNYGWYLEENPPADEVEIFENSSWSCPHGVERWRSDCGCKLDPGRNWHQRWRKPLRDALDWLRRRMDPFFEERAGRLVADPWAARNDYVEVVADRSAERIERFCAAHRRRPLERGEVVELLKLLEMQRYGMLMYTSCGWFFDDISGLEAVQNLKFACRAVQLAADLGLALEDEFLDHLAAAESNIAELKNGAEIYRRFVRPDVADLRRVAAHVAMEAAFRGEMEETRLFCYRAEAKDFRRAGSGATSLAVGRMETRSLVTLESDEFVFAVLALGGHDFQCAIRRAAESPDYDKVADEILSAYRTSSLTDVVRLLDRRFGARYYSLKDLFLESRRKILSEITREKMERFQGVQRTIYEECQRLVEFLHEADAPVPKMFLVAAENVLNDDLGKALDQLIEENRTEWLRFILDQARRWDLSIRVAETEPRVRAYLNGLVERLVESPDESVARRAAELVAAVGSLGLPVYLWQAQNIFRTVIAKHGPALERRSDESGRAVLEALRRLGEELGFRNGGFGERET